MSVASEDVEAAAHGRVTVIAPERRWELGRLAEIWAYRELWWVLTRRDVVVRYQQTVIGAGWAVVQPLSMMVVFTVFFGRMAGIPSDSVPYPVFSYCGLMVWLFFANTLSNVSNSLPANAHLITKIYFPRLILPLSAIGLGLLDAVVASALLIGLMFCYGLVPALTLLLTPLIFVGVALFVMGIGTILCALNVRFRDFRYVIPLMTQLWMFATPVVYPASKVPAEYQWLLTANPMAAYVEGMRDMVLGRPMAASQLGIALAISLLLFVFGMVVFARTERRFAEVI